MQVLGRGAHRWWCARGVSARCAAVSARRAPKARRCAAREPGADVGGFAWLCGTQGHVSRFVGGSKIEPDPSLHCVRVAPSKGGLPPAAGNGGARRVGDARACRAPLSAGAFLIASRVRPRTTVRVAPHTHTYTHRRRRRQGPRHGSVRVRGPAAGRGGGAAGPDDVCVERRRVAWPDAGAGCSVRWAQLAPYSWPCDGTAVPTTAARVAWATSAAPLCACWLLHLPFSPLLPPLPPFAWHSSLHSPPTTTPPLLPHPRPPQ